MNEKPTPRTDAAEFNRHSLLSERPPQVVPADFARQLERENQTFRAAQKACEDCDAPRVDRIDELERELAAEREQVAILQSDEKRLVGFAKTYRLRADELADKLAAERDLADSLAETLDGLDWLAAEPPKALTAWKEARK